jgi:hypothetical protein
VLDWGEELISRGMNDGLLLLSRGDASSVGHFSGVTLEVDLIHIPYVFFF